MTRRDFLKLSTFAGLGFLVGGKGGSSMSDKPNVILILTDDQGYGDLGCHGNPIIKTPNLDRLYGESVRFTNFHVAPTCSPTRAGLMTGLYNNRTGVWHTIAGRSLLRDGIVTMADLFKASGYRTGIFGKWHLGDNYPFRPQDRGFGTVLIHKGGGVGQTPDYWGNDYFDDTYFRSGKPEKFEGYCTDVWFEEAMRFIEECAAKGQSFFCYIPTNAPHGPYNVPRSYSDLYRGKVPDRRANFWGMITNFDENVGWLRSKLRKLGIEEDTILIFLTDNGTAEGCSLDKDGFVMDGYNAGMRGKKGSEYDGGHRVPLFIHWPGGGLKGGRDIDRLAANIDLLPTLIDLCGLKAPDDVEFDGTSLKPLLIGETESWPDRVLVVDSQRVEYPIKWRKSSVMTQRWRLINGEELYDMSIDPGQRKDVSKEYPDVVRRLRDEYERWWDSISRTFDGGCPIVIGTEHERVSTLTTHDWHGERCAWNQNQIKQGLECNGYWIIQIASDGRYEFELRRWPKEADVPINDAVPGGRAFNFKTARIRIGDQEEIKPVEQGAKGIKFAFSLKAGVTRLQTFLSDAEGRSIGAYYVYARRIFA